LGAALTLASGSPERKRESRRGTGTARRISVVGALARGAWVGVDRLFDPREQQIYAAHQESGGQLTHDVMGPMPSALLSMAEFIAPLTGTIIDAHGILAVIQSIEAVHWILLILGAGLLVLPGLWRSRNAVGPVKP
jgi:hypothetical protein